MANSGLGMGVAFTLHDQFSGKAARIGASMDKLSGKTDRTAARLNKAAGLMSAGFTSMAAGAVLAAPFIVGIKHSMEFNAEISAVGAVARATGEEMARLKQTAIELGSATKFTATEAASGMKFFAMAGFDVNQQIAAMPGMLSLAAAAGSDLGVTADIVSNTLTAMGMAAEQSTQMADELSATFTRANVDITMMGESLRYSAQSANNLGVSSAQLFGMIGMLGDVGVQGSVAGTALNQLFLKIGEMTKDSGKLDLLASLGISREDLVDSKDNIKDMTALIPILTKGISSVEGSADRLNIIQDLFGIRGAKAFNAFMTQGGKDFTEFVKTIEEDAGAAENIAKKMMDNLQGDFTSLKSRMEAMWITIGDTVEPVLRKVAQAFIGILDVVTKFMKTGIGKYVLYVTAGLAAFLLVGGAVALVVGGMQYAFYSLAPAIWSSLAPILPFVAAGAALVLLGWGIYEAIGSANPVIRALGIALAGVLVLLTGPMTGGAIIAVVTIVRAVREFSKATQEQVEGSKGWMRMLYKLGAVATAVYEMLTMGPEGAFQLTKDTADKLESLGLLEPVLSWGAAMSTMFAAFKETLLGMYQAVKAPLVQFITWFSKSAEYVDIFQGSLQGAGQDLQTWADRGKMFAYGLAAAFALVGGIILIAFLPVIATFAAVIGAAYGMFWILGKIGGMGAMFEALKISLIAIGAAIALVGIIIVSPILIAVGIVVALVYAVRKAVDFFANDFIDAVSRWGQDLLDTFQQAYRNVLDFTHFFVDNMKTAFANFFSGAWLKQGLVMILTLFMSAYNSISQFIGGFVTKAVESGKQFVSSLLSGIKSGWSQLVQWITAKWSEVLGVFEIPGIGNVFEDAAGPSLPPAPATAMPSSASGVIQNSAARTFAWSPSDFSVNATSGPTNVVVVAELDGENIAKNVTTRQDKSDRRRQ